MNYLPLPNENQSIMHWQSLPGASIGLVLQQAIKEAKRPFLIIAPDNLTVSHLDEALLFFGGEDTQVMHFPDWETLPYDHFSPHQDIISERLATLYQLPQMTHGAIITTASTLLHYLPPCNYLTQHSFLLKVGDVLNLDVFKTQLVTAGYHSVTQVREHGEFAIRGSIIDLFPMGSLVPFRIDLFDNEVEALRIFSTDTQRSLEKRSEIRLLPAKEFPLNKEAIDFFRLSWRSQFPGNPLNCPIYQDVSEGIASAGLEYYLPLFFPQLSTLFDYLPANTLIVTLEDIVTKSGEFWQEIDNRYQQTNIDHTRPILKPDQLFLSVHQLQQCIAKYDTIEIESPTPNAAHIFSINPLPSLQINHQASQPLSALQQFIETWPGRILFCSESMGRRELILQLFKSISLSPALINSWEDFLTNATRIGIAIANFETGFCLMDPPIAIITENELYGNRVMQRRLRKKAKQQAEAIVRDLAELQIGDPVVHIDHGVAYYRGLETLTVGEQAGEFLSLQYQGGDKLYVPVSSLHVISRYAGADLDHTPISKLGTDHWQKAKRHAAEKARDVAAELLELYARRSAKLGEACILPQDQYDAFAAAFPFEETPDQLQAIEQVFNDMKSERPMDRVICGDVGFGKTEVAVRAAFLAVQNNKQVAMLVPTTLLAQQHFQTFQDRFANWPIRVEALSRFKTAKEQRKIIDLLLQGQIDILIGTHKLLQPDVAFKSLGLVIIDEEHRFGVKQKERFKALRSSVDILTLTATPIPRTLNMALAGMRDLSIIATPPAKRLSVKTFVHEYQNSIIHEAIQREILRGGQVYFLHNDLSTINKKAEEIKSLLPEARTVIAHGQMHERDLERVMTDFYHRRFNVLVCSTIIESGIDIPTANTIIINRADKFGIAQLHQLRGRVGRSHHQAYAYLLVPTKEHITADAKKRLDAIAVYGELGIGFTLATHDLEIRGAGELLGEEQSGDMQQIGFSLYMDLLSRAVELMKSGEFPDDPAKLLIHKHSEIDLHIIALIPEKYIPDVQLRLQCYKRISIAKTQAELDDIQVEMVDRFGLLPEPLKQLIAIHELKQQAEGLGIIKLEANNKAGRMEFVEQPNINPLTLIRLIQARSQQFRLDGPQRLQFFLEPHEPNERVQRVKQILDLLSVKE